jgi:hypothetical protein
MRNKKDTTDILIKKLHVVKPCGKKSTEGKE